MMDSMIMIASLSPAIQFKALIQNYGYTSAYNKKDNKKLYVSLKNRLMSNELSHKEMNVYISHARAYALSNVLYDLCKDNKRKLEKFNNLHIRFRHRSQGRSLPNSKIKMSATDKRRRVALVRWYILPKL